MGSPACNAEECWVEIAAESEKPTGLALIPDVVLIERDPMLSQERSKGLGIKESTCSSHAALTSAVFHTQFLKDL